MPVLESRPSPELLLALVNALPHAVVVVDHPAGALRFVNTAFRELFGLQEPLPPDAASLVTWCRSHLRDPTLLRDLAKDPGAETWDREVTLVDGRALRWVVRALPVLPDTSRPVLHVLDNITSSRLVEEELRHSEARFRSVVEDQTEMICRFMPDGTLTFVNEAYCRCFGQPGPALLGTRFLPDIPGTDWQGVRAKFALLTPERPAVTYEHRVRLPQGEERWQQWTARAIYERPGAVLEYQAVGRDCTDRKRAEEALLTAKAQLKALFDNSPYLVWIKDREGRYQAVNEPFVRTCGRNRAEDVVGRTDLEVWPRALAEMYRDDDVKVMTSRQQRLLEESVVRHGQARTVETFKAPVFDARGEVVGTTGLSRDITDAKRAAAERAMLEERLHQVQKMEAVGQLAGGVAHDFNNILSVINSYSSFILDELDADSRLRADVKEIASAAERAAALTRQLLAFSRKQTIQPRDVPVGPLLVDLSKMLQRLIGEHIHLVLDVREDAGWIHIDPSQLEQVVINLAVNARDAMVGGGTLTLGCRAVHLDAETLRAYPDLQPGDYVQLTVADTGVGMSRDVLQRLFEPFFTTKPKGKGTGLGLAMVYGAVKQNRGHVEVTSVPGAGTTFRLAFRRIQEHAVAAADSPDAGNRGRGELVLFVEDDAPVRRSTVRILTSAGYRVLPAESGEEALELFRQRGQEIALVVTDVVMPGMGGAQLGQRLKALQPDVRLLYCSGYTDDLLGEQGVLSADVHFLGKPFEIGALLRKVRSLLDASGT